MCIGPEAPVGRSVHRIADIDPKPVLLDLGTAFLEHIYPRTRDGDQLMYI